MNKHESKIEFRKAAGLNTWVMRITPDRCIEVNEDVEVTETARTVLDAMQVLLDAQRKPWVGLTDEDHEHAMDICMHIGVEGLIFWLEDKLREKNT